ncbi:MAG: hypothetical protein JXA18_14850 [Chitinispirillaceae bacterium]|nr:hypothetical protein [Chitinispirillaceae bacterium]
MNELIAQSNMLLTDLSAQPMVLLIAVPLFAGIVCRFLPSKGGAVAAVIAFLTGIYAFLIAWPLFNAKAAAFSHHNWLALRLDGINGFILLATTVFSLLILIYSFGFMKGKDRQNHYYAYILWTLGASCGALLASEFILLLVFWGILGVTLYLLTGISGPEAAGAAKKAAIVIGGSDSILILGIALLWVIRHTTRMQGAPVEFGGPLSYIAFFCLATAAFAKAGAMPFHSWVPDCGEKAPASVAAFLPASLDKLLGIYFLYRTTTLFTMNSGVTTALAVIGAGTIIFAVMMALVQHDLKRLLSYHAVSQVGYMVLGISTGTPLGIAGSLFHMLNHAMYKSCLFLCAGAIEHRTGTSDLDKLGGLAKAMPVTLFSCIIASMAISGIPPLNGFASKWMIYQGIIESGRSGGVLWVVWLTAAMVGSALTLASFVKLLHASFFRQPSPEVAAAKPREVGPGMWLPMGFLALLCVAFGLRYLSPLSRFIFPAVNAPVSFTGKWFVGPATVMIAGALFGGLLLYLLGTVKKPRVCRTYIGGEYLDEVYISGSEKSTARDVEVTGVDFYQTIRDMTPFKQIYTMAQWKLFDLYEVGTHVSFFISKIFQFFHTGVLRQYISWYVIGMIILLWLMK